MINFFSGLVPLFDKAIYFAITDSYYLFPLIGSIHLFLIGLSKKKNQLILFSLVLFILFCIVFPFVKLIPNLGSDAFSEFQKIDLSEVFFYIKTLSFFAGWSIKNYILWFLIIIIYSIIFLILFFLSEKFHFLKVLKINYLIIFTIIFFPTFLNLYKVSILYKASIKEKENQAKNIIYSTDKLDIKLQKPKDLSLILYIGEATSRLHWSIYKYFRPTNQSLENFNKNNPLIIYDDVYSTHTHTSPSLLDALTIEAEIEKENDLKIISDYNRYPIVDILNNKQINTKLYSTQAKSGSWNLASKLIFKNAEKKEYSFKHNLGNANYIDKNKLFDHEFLEYFVDKIKVDSVENYFYVFHSYAGHGNYKKNIPKKYHYELDNFYSSHDNEAIFGRSFKNNQKEFLENYDSAMNYISDNIVFTLQKISKLEKPFIFIYTADHGESPLTGRAHDSSRFIWEMASVPFLIYFNDSAKLKYSELFKELNKRAKQKNTEFLSNLPSLILEIFGVKVFDNNDRAKHVSKCIFGDGNCLRDYIIIRNQLNSIGVVNLNYPVEENDFIDNTDRGTTYSNMKSYLTEINSNSKICSHRTNSIARFIRFNAILNCMEIDVLVDGESLVVAHSKDLSSSLNLKDLIKIQKKKQNTLWLDIKNLDNLGQCNKLSEILQNIALENSNIDFFVELPSHVLNKINIFNECISDMKSINFSLSLYIPNDIYLKCLEEENENYFENNSCKYSDELLKKIDKSSLFTDISFDYINYKYLRKSKYIDNFRLNTWHIPDEKIVSIVDKNFRLIIPFNDDINYN